MRPPTPEKDLIISKYWLRSLCKEVSKISLFKILHYNGDLFRFLKLRLTSYLFDNT